MSRPLWTDAAPDVARVAEGLEAAAQAAHSPLRFEPVALPAGADLGVLHQAALVRARRQLAAAHSELDRILAQEVRAIDDLVRTANLLVERLREWYALHAPEATRLVTDAETLARLVAEHGSRDAVMATLDQAAQAAVSLGTDLEPQDLAVLQGFAGTLASVHSTWTALEERVSGLMAKVAPNVADVAGPVIGARLIAISGGLDRLASWPAGTVQLLGAETALFRHLKEGTKPPKHGILFQHPLVHQAPPYSRGAVARAIALAVATAAKADAFTKSDLRAHLQAQLKADLDRIAQRKPRPRAPPGMGGPRGPWRGPPQGQGARTPWRGPPRGAPGTGRSDAPRAPGPGPGAGERLPPRSFREPAGGPPRKAWGRGPRADDGRAPWGARDRAGPRGGGRGADRGDDGWQPRGPPRGPGGGGGGGGGAGGGGTGAGGRGPPRGGKPFRRKPQGAFRSDNRPAPPPGRRRED